MSNRHRRALSEKPSHTTLMPAAMRSADRRLFPWWLASYETSIVPAAMGPVALGIAMFETTGTAQTGSALMCAMVLGQVTMAVPLEALSRRSSSKLMLISFLLAQAGALLGLAFGIRERLPLLILILLAALSGAPSGATFSLFRHILAQSSAPPIVLRRIAISLTVNEGVYVGGPLVAAFCAVWSPVLPVLVMAGSVMLSAVLTIRLNPGAPAGRRSSGGFAFRQVWPWLACVFLASAALAFVEVGAVEISVRLGWGVGAAGFVAATACVASALTGTYVAWRNAEASNAAVFSLIFATIGGAVLIVVSDAPWLVICGCVVVGSGVAPLGTFLSVFVQNALPEHRLSAGMAMFRMAHGSGIVGVALLLALIPSKAAGVVTSVAATVIACVCAIAVRRS